MDRRGDMVIVKEEVLADDLQTIFQYENGYDSDCRPADFEGFFFTGNDIIPNEEEYSHQVVEDTLTEPNYFIDQIEEYDQPVSTYRKRRSESKKVIEGFKCDSCDFVAKTRFALKRHSVTHREEQGTDSSSSDSSSGSDGSSSSSSSDSDSSDCEKDLYRCPLCEFSTSVETLFENHGKAHLKIQTIAANKMISSGKKSMVNDKKRAVQPVVKKVIKSSSKSGKRNLRSKKDLGDFKVMTEAQKIKREGKNYVCTLCNFTCNNKHTQKIHLASHKGEWFKCYQCDFTSTKNAVLFRHLLVHTSERNFPCPHCKHASKTKGDLKKHLATHSDQKEFQCPECSYQTGRGFSLRRHFVVAHTDSPQNFNKPNQARKVWMQKAPEASDATRPKEKSKLYKCRKCDFSTYEKNLSFIHRQSHSDVKYKCIYCNFATSWESVLKRHEENHSDVKRFSCNECSYKTNIGRSFENHMMTHTGERRFQCPTCPYASIYKICLQRHLNVHLKKGKTIKCDLCDYETRWRNDLQFHMLEHR